MNFWVSHQLRVASINLVLLNDTKCHVYCADYSHGFGGKYGVEKDRQDKSASGWDHIEKVDKHESQKGKVE